VLAEYLHLLSMPTLRSSRWKLKIEKNSHGGTTTIRLIGRFQSEHVGELKKQLQEDGPLFVLDLKQVTIVDVDVVRFLGACKGDGVKIVHCSRYIREWMRREAVSPNH
jgi:hypothetical protein